VVARAGAHDRRDETGHPGADDDYPLRGLDAGFEAELRRGEVVGRDGRRVGRRLADYGIGISWIVGHIGPPR
jgi:hypothetical protein